MSFNKELVKIDEAIKTCTICENTEKFKYSSISYGSNRELLFVGESPAKNGWMLTGKAFINPKGELVPTAKVLNALLNILNMNLEDITFTEAVKCYVPDRKMLTQCSLNCWPHLSQQIYELKPKMIIPLGEHPTRALLGCNKKFKLFRDVVGKEHIIKIEDRDFTVYPIYHPSPISPIGYKGNVSIFNKLKEILNLFE